MNERKTRDVFDIEGDYAHGFEIVTRESARSEARERLREYRENEPQTEFRIVKRRESVS